MSWLGMSNPKQALGKSEDDTFLCPICGVKKCNNGATRRALRSEHMRVLLAGDRHIQSQIGTLLGSNSTVRICRTCKNHADRALVAAVAKYNTPSFQTTAGSRKTPVALQEVFRVKIYPTPVCYIDVITPECLLLFAYMPLFLLDGSFQCRRIGCP